LFGSIILASCTPESQEPLNVVLIVVDTLRADALSLTGYPRETSPNIDLLASDAFVFRNAFSGGANTSTAMPAIMTARLAYFSDQDPPCEDIRCETRWNEHTWFGMQRFYDNGEKGLPIALDTLAEILNRNGYTTAGFVTNPHVKKQFQFDQGFNVYEEIFRTSYPIYGLGEDVSKAAIGLLNDQFAEPFFLYLHYMDPHAPYLAPQRYRNRFTFERVPGLRDEDVFEQWDIDSTLATNAPKGFKEHLRGLYDAEVAYVDDCIGRVLDALKDKGLYRNTVVVLTADHGEEFLEHGKTGHKGRFYDEHMRIPLIIRSPHNGKGIVDSIARNFDILPTLLDIVDIDASVEALDGKSLAPLMKSHPDDLKLGTFANMPFPETRRMYRDERYKLIIHIEKPHDNKMYDLWKDPGETENLYTQADYESTRNNLHQAINRFVGKLQAEDSSATPSTKHPREQLDEATREQLKALGYIK
jgi:arylsulfatase